MLAGPLPTDPRNIPGRFLSLENGGILRPDGGPYDAGCFGINGDKPLTRRLQKMATDLNPVPNLVTTPMVQREVAAVRKRVLARGRKFLLGQIKDPRVRPLVHRAGPVAKKYLHPFEV
jgi:hypothetical protein